MYITLTSHTSGFVAPACAFFGTDVPTPTLMKDRIGQPEANHPGRH